MGLGCLARLEIKFNSLKSSLRFAETQEIAEKAVFTSQSRTMRTWLRAACLVVVLVFHLYFVEWASWTSSPMRP